ncbi:MAG TPA: 4Fe-4S dicluster domain-containing protein [Deltaproteobacteria bacterium]|nr:4Fe-4S dicluster domain-containing protein [Deltaproteobacteria bacterium]
MKWTQEAKDGLSRVPFFVRKRVKARVEEEAARSGSNQVTLRHLHTCRKRFLNRMEEEVRGFQIDSCFGREGCPNRAVDIEGLALRLEEKLANRDLKAFLKERVDGPLKMHHEFRVSISDCPNACSRPQIADIGIMGASRPRVSEEDCTLCGACVEVCREEAISTEHGYPVVDEALCLSCGQCISVCPTGTISQGKTGCRIMIGGKLGRHPRLALELPGILEPNDLIMMVDNCLDYYQNECMKGERLGEIMERTGWKGPENINKEKA